MLSGLTTKLIAGGIVLAVIGGFAWHYLSLHDKIAALETTVALQETALDLKDTEIASLQDQAASIRRRTQEANEKLWAAEAEADALEQKLAKHDMEVMVKRHPDWMTKLMQKGTDKQLKKIEEAANEALQ